MSTLSRRSFFGRAASVAALPLLSQAPRAFGDDEPVPAADPAMERKPHISEASLAATKKGLDWLAKDQKKDGFWGPSAPVAITSLAGCAFLAEGHTPGAGKHGDRVRKAIEYVLKCSSPKKGYIAGATDHMSRMHGHGFATMFLAEAFGMMALEQDDIVEKMKKAIQKAVEVIETSQTSLGGWGYMPEPTYDEGSTTVAQVMALRSCRNAGFMVQKSTIDKGVGYLKKSANPDGSFKYSLQGGGGGGTVALTAGAVASLQLFGEYEAKEVKKGLEFLKKNRNQLINQNGGGGHTHYASLYATMAAWYLGGASWDEWFPPMRDKYIKAQHADGSFDGEMEKSYCTAYTVLTLAVPYQYLPIFQI